MTQNKILRSMTGGLAFYQGENRQEVSIKECFPWTSPDKYFSIRNKDDEEIIFISDLNERCFCERIDISYYLKQVKFAMEIIHIRSIKEEYELRKYDVLTTSGERVFYTRIDDWPIVKEDESVFIMDVSKDVYLIKKLNALDEISRKKISYYVD